MALAWSSEANASSYSLYQGSTLVYAGGNLAFTDAGLANNTSYSFTLTATGLGGTSAASSAVTATPEAAPGAPSGVSATVANTSSVVSWTAPTGTFSAQLPLSYSVFYNGGSGNVLAAAGLSTLTATVTGLTNGVAYTFAVTATDAYGQTSGFSSSSAAVTPIGAPAAPTTISATETGGNVGVAWTAAASTPAGPVTGYYVYRNGSQVGTTSGTSFTDSSVAPGTYTYSVAAYNAVATGAATSAAQITVVAAPATPAAPSATPTSGQVVLTWAAETNASSFTLYQGSTQLYAGAGLSFTATGLTNNTPYSFTLTATGLGGTSAASSATLATPEAVPAAPTGVNATVADSSALVSWTAPAGTFSAQLPLTYTVFYNGGTGYTQFATGLNAMSETVTGLADGTSYSFEVTATDAYGQASGYSSASAVVTPIGAPAAPSGVSATETGGNVNVGWTAANSTSSDPVAGYYVYRNGSQVGTTSNTSFTDSSVAPGTYTYSVTAYNVVATGAAASAPQVTVVAAPATPAAPAAAPSSGQVVLSWPSETNATSYALYQNGSQVYAGANLSFTVTGLANNTPYSFTLKATGPGGTSAASLATLATPEAVPVAPSGVGATVANSSSVVSWTAPAGTFSAQLPLTYTVLYNGGSGYTQFATGLSGTSETVTGLSNGTSYSFEVTPTDAYGQTWAIRPRPRPHRSVRPPARPAPRPSNWPALRWSPGPHRPAPRAPPSAGTTSTVQTRATRRSPPSAVPAPARTPTARPAAGSTYTYSVAAYNAVGTSGQASSSPLTMVAAPGSPGGPCCGRQQRPGRGPLGPLRPTPPPMPCTRTAARSTPEPTSATRQPAATNNTAYSFTLTATGLGGTSALSPAATATPEAAPGAPTGASATVANASNRRFLDRSRRDLLVPVAPDLFRVRQQRFGLHPGRRRSQRPQHHGLRAR